MTVLLIVVFVSAALVCLWFALRMSPGPDPSQQSKMPPRRGELEQFERNLLRIVDEIKRKN